MRFKNSVRVLLAGGRLFKAVSGVEGESLVRRGLAKAEAGEGRVVGTVRLLAWCQLCAEKRH